MQTLSGEFETVTLEKLRVRKSEKWAKYPPDVLPAFVAEMDFDLAEPIRRALEEAISIGDTGYAAPNRLSSAFAAFAAERLHWSVMEDRIFAVPDVMAGVEEALRLLTCRGDGVVINPPVYPPYFPVIANLERKVVEVPLLSDDHLRWSIDLDNLEAAFQAGAKAYLLCSPHNPIGRVWTQRELRDVVDLAQRYGVALIGDEIFAALTMPDRTFTPVLSVASEDQPCIALTAASKAWNIPGLKCGVMVANNAIRAQLRTQLLRRVDEVLYRTGHFGVLATIAAFREGGPWLDALRLHLDGNRHRLSILLGDRLPAIRYCEPEATYLAWLDCRELGWGDDPAARFLERGRVALERGTKFGSPGAGFVRLNMGTSTAILDELVERMSKAL